MCKYLANREDWFVHLLDKKHLLLPRSCRLPSSSFEAGPAIGPNYTSSHSFEGGAAKMASSKEVAGSEPSREKKREASEDHEEPFMFLWVSVFTVSSTK